MTAAESNQPFNTDFNLSAEQRQAARWRAWVLSGRYQPGLDIPADFMNTAPDPHRNPDDTSRLPSGPVRDIGHTIIGGGEELL